MKVILIAAFLVGVYSTSNAAATPPQKGMEVVFCYDEKRALVQRVRAKNCPGNIVTSAQARALTAQINAERRAKRDRATARAAHKANNGFRFKSAGTGFAVNQNGELLTNAHVIRGCDALEAHHDDHGQAYAVRVKAVSEKTDLAIIRLNIKTPTILRFTLKSPPDGSPLALIGYPTEGMIRRIPRLTPVMISHRISNPAKHGLIGIAGDVRRGNSGGPALDSRGRAVGVLKAKIDTVAAHRLTGKVLRNLGVVVETTRVVRFLESTRTPYSIDGSRPYEKTGQELFNHGRRAVYRINCLVKS